MYQYMLNIHECGFIKCSFSPLHYITRVLNGTSNKRIKILNGFNLPHFPDDHTPVLKQLSTCYIRHPYYPASKKQRHVC